MSSSLADYSLREKRRLAKLLSPVTTHYGHPDVSEESKRFAIDTLQLHTRADPEDDFVWYVLSSFYLELDELVDSLEAVKQAYSIDQTNPRYPYGIATAYNALSTFRGMEHYEANTAKYLQIGITRERAENLATQLASLSLTYEEAAQQAIIYFQETLTHRLSKMERSHVEFHLGTLLNAFPQFNKSQRPIVLTPPKAQGPGCGFRLFMIARIAFACFVVGIVIGVIAFFINGTFSWDAVWAGTFGAGLFYGLPVTIRFLWMTR